MRAAYKAAPVLILVLVPGAIADGLASLIPLFNPTYTWSLLNDPNVKNELKITKDQEKVIQASQKKWEQRTGQDADTIYRMTEPGKEAKIRALGTMRGEEVFESLGQVLTHKQVNRLKQIILQHWGIVLFDHPEIRQALKLSNEQVATLHSTFEEVRNDVVREVQAGRISREDGYKQWLALGQGVPDKVREKLNEEQRQRLRGLLGEPFLFR